MKTETDALLPNGCPLETAERLLETYDARLKQKQVAKAEQLRIRAYTGLTIAELRRFVREHR